MKTILNWKVFWILLAAAVIATVLVLPYALEVQSSAIDLSKMELPLPVVVVIQTASSTILFALAILAGLFFAGHVGLMMPILDSWTRGQSAANKIRAILPLSILLGLLSAALVVALELFYFQPALLRELGDSAAALNLQTATAWKGFLASFYGGIAEEIQLRLFVMSLFVWLGKFISKTPEGQPTRAVFWAANILAAVLFGLAHLPTTSLLVPLTPLIMTRAVALNGLIGITCGWLFWKRGLESAMVAHFSADIVLHVLLAL